MAACEASENHQKEENMTTASTSAIATEQTAIASLINTLFTATDERDWAAVKGTMADSVYTDYTALGGQAGFQSPEAIVEGWQALLPGFERTIHQIHNVASWVADERATATFDAIATHYLQASEGENYWTVFVGYDTEFMCEAGQWKLARIDLSLYQQVGNTTLPGLAKENVSNGQIPTPPASSPATESVEEFFSALEAQDLDAVLANMAENVVQDMPLAPANFPTSVEGKVALGELYGNIIDLTQSYERTCFPTLNPHEVLVKFQGTVKTGAEQDYRNYYVSIFEVDEQGKLLRIIEQFNPTILLNNWPGLQPAHYSVHDAGARRDAGVSREIVYFMSNGIRLQGHLFFPPNFDADRSYPTAIVTGSWTSVKEQMPDEYASLLAQQGIMTLTFDFTGFGQSEGQPRQVEDYQLKIADIQAAVDFLSQHKNVDQEQISGFGVCASSGYMAHATAQDKRIKNLVLVAPWLHNPAIAKMIYDLRPGGTEGLLAAATAAKERYAETGEMTYVLAASELDPLSAMYVPENAFDYYLNPAKAAGPYYDNRFAVSSWEPWLTFDGIAVAEDINQPVLIVHSEKGAVPQGAKDFYAGLSSEKDIVWLNDYDQQQLYFEQEAVSAAIDQVATYLQNR